MPYISLHNHSHYSIRDGISTPKQMAERAKELGYNSLAITDHGTCSGWLTFKKACKDAGIRPIFGYELYEYESEKDRGNSHITLLAKTNEGVKNLIAINNLAVTHFKRYPRASMRDIHDLGLGKGIVCLTGCAASPLMKCIYHEPKAIYKSSVTVAEAKLVIKENWLHECTEYVGLLQSTFDNVFIEVQKHGLAIQEVALPILRELGATLSIPCVATTDAHYTNPKDRSLQDIVFQADPQKRTYATSYPRAWIMDEKEIDWAEQCELDVSQTIADMCQGDVIESEPTIPEQTQYDIRELCQYALKKYMDDNDIEDKKTYHDRLDYELGVIYKYKVENYFAIIYDLCEYGRSIGYPPGDGRGSVGGSLAAFVLGIHSLDPIEHNLFFERFLNAGRVSEGRIKLPDIDLDFSPKGRDLLDKYMKDKYGDNNVYGISNFDFLHSKSAIRTYCRAVHPSVNMDSLCEIANNFSDLTEFMNSEEFLKLDKAGQHTIEGAMKLEGLITSNSKHACAFVVMPNLTKHLPLRMNPKNKEIIIDLDKNDVEAFGGLKLDILGLNQLAKIDQTKEAIEKYGVKPKVMDKVKQPPKKEIPIDKTDLQGIWLRSLRKKGMIVEKFPTMSMTDLQAIVKDVEWQLPSHDIEWMITAYQKTYLVHSVVDDKWISNDYFAFPFKKHSLSCGLLSVADKWVLFAPDSPTSALVYSMAMVDLREWFGQVGYKYLDGDEYDQQYSVPLKDFEQFMKKYAVITQTILDGEIK